MANKSASEIMRSLGVVQEGDPILRQTACPFGLPAGVDDARRVVAKLNSAADRVRAAHVFGKGMGIAAPQIGIDRAAAIVRAPGGETITLLNPKIIDQGAQEDEQYEGCLSFFDVRCMVPRSRGIQVEHQDVDGHRQITIFQDGLARLVAHEVDHLFGVLCKDRMRPGVESIPVTEYRGIGQEWHHQ
jgi:peptide deformylase